jgi:arsenate reductase
VEDPAAVEGSDETKRRAFLTAFNQLRNRIHMFASLPLGKLDAMAIKKKLADIGKT